MKTITKWLLMLVMLALLVVPAFAQDNDLTLSPFTNEQFGIQGVVPESWKSMGNGLYGPNPGPADPTMLALQAVPMQADQLLKSLLPQLALTEVPESVGTTETDYLTWTLYKIDVDTRGIKVTVDLALAENEGKTYLALLQTKPETYDALHESVFVPVLDAYAPLAVAEATPEDLPYVAEEVTFVNGDITLAGTLTLPEGDGPFPAVVLITGSGPEDRDESLVPLAEIKPFRLLADGLTRAGIAVLRYDDRGVGQSTGDFSAATTTDFAADAAAAVDYLLTRDDINGEQVGVLGHSEGGIITTILGATNTDIAFIISLGGPGVSGKDVVIKQGQLIMQANGASQEQIDFQTEFMEGLDEVLKAGDQAALETFVHEMILKQMEFMSEEEQAAVGNVEQMATIQAAQFASPWWKEFFYYNPADGWAKTTVPVLAILGGLDLQVSAEQNGPAIEAALNAAGNEDFTVVTIPGMNHLGQKATTGSPNEYGTLEQTFTPELIPTITDWLLERVDAAGE